MANVAFTHPSIYTRVLTHVSGCPIPLIAQAWRNALISLCVEAKVWRVEVPFSTTAGVYDYVVNTYIPAGTVLQSVLLVKVDGNYVPLYEYERLTVKYPAFPDVANTQKPVASAMQDQRTLVLQPVPDDAYNVVLTITVKPTTSATDADEFVMEEYRDSLVHGALFELLAIPERPWTNLKLADYYGRRFKFDKMAAKAKVEKGYSTLSQCVHIPRVV